MNLKSHLILIALLTIAAGASARVEGPGTFAERALQHIPVPAMGTKPAPAAMNYGVSLANPLRLRSANPWEATPLPARPDHGEGPNTKKILFITGSALIALGIILFVSGGANQTDQNGQKSGNEALSKAGVGAIIVGSGLMIAASIMSFIENAGEGRRNSWD